MSKRKLVILAMAVSAMFVMGCSHMPAGLAPSSSPVEVGEYTVLGHAVGSDSYFSLAGFIPFGEPDYNAAIQDAISQVPGGTSMINVRSSSSRIFALVGYVVKLKVEGDVIK